MLKKLFPYLLLLVLLPGNLFLGIYFWRIWRLAERKFALSSDAQYRYNALDPRFTVVADAREPESNFWCISENCCIQLWKRNGKIKSVHALSGKEEFSWLVIGAVYLLNYENTDYIDLDRDFLFDVRHRYGDDARFIRRNGVWHPVARVDYKTFTAVGENGKTFHFKDGVWREVQER